LEVLEDRLTPNTRFVVPLEAPVDNVTDFRTLHAALTTPGLAAGDVIQIERGALPGSINDASLGAALAATGGDLTIEGDPAVPLDDIPAFAVATAITIDEPGLGHFTLRHVQIHLTGGNLTVDDDDVSIRDSRIVSDFVLPAGQGALQLAATALRATIIGSYIASTAGLDGSEVIHITPVAGSKHHIGGNTIVSVAGNDQHLLVYGDAGATTDVADQILDNRFLGGGGSLFATVPLLQVGALVQNVLILGNAIQSQSDFTVGINVLPTASAIIYNNRLRLGGSFSIGIKASGGAGGTTTTVNVGANQIIVSEALGTALSLEAGALGAEFNVSVRRNHFFGRVGVAIAAGGGGSVSGINLGGIITGGPGANDFTGFTAPAAANRGAIVNGAAAAQGFVLASNNQFQVDDEETVIWDSADDATRGDVSTTFAYQPVAFAVGRDGNAPGGAEQGFAFNFDGSLKGGASSLYGRAARGVHVAVGAVTSHAPEVIVAPGAGVAARIHVISGLDGAVTFSFLAYPLSFRGGAFVAVGNVIDDFVSAGNEIIVAPGGGGRQPVKVFDRDGILVASFKPFGNRYAGPIHVAAGNVDGVGYDEIIVTRDNRQVRVLNGVGAVLNSFRAAGVGQPFVAAGDVNGDGRADIILGDGAGRNVRIVDRSGGVIYVIAATYPRRYSGITVAAVDLDGNGAVEVLTGTIGRGRVAKVFNPLNGALLGQFTVLPAGSAGFFVGGWA
jgi:hypothetical protein